MPDQEIIVSHSVNNQGQRHPLSSHTTNSDWTAVDVTEDVMATDATRAPGVITNVEQVDTRLADHTAVTVVQYNQDMHPGLGDNARMSQRDGAGHPDSGSLQVWTLDAKVEAAAAAAAAGGGAWAAALPELRSCRAERCRRRHRPRRRRPRPMGTGGRRSSPGSI